MKISMIWALIAISAIVTLAAVVVITAVKETRAFEKRTAEIVRRRVEEQQAAFQKVDLELYNKRHENKIIGDVDFGHYDVEEKFGISA